MKITMLPLSIFLSLSWARAQTIPDRRYTENKVESVSRRDYNDLFSEHKKLAVPKKSPERASRSLEEYVWAQIGLDIDGEAPYDQSGYSVALSDDKSTLVIGAFYNDGNGADAGHVRVFHYDGGSGWVQVGTDLDGKSAGDMFGTSVAVSSDGTTVAVGGVDTKNDRAGHVRLFRLLNGSDWRQIGYDIVGETVGDDSGRSVSLSDDGNIVAIGAPLNDSDAGQDAGQVRVYAYSSDSQSFVQLGLDIHGERPLDSFGFAVSLAGDGQTVAIGMSRLLAVNGMGSGSVRVFKYHPEDKWVQTGSTIEGSNQADSFGLSVALSKTGDVMIIGAPYSDDNGNNSGIVSIYQLSDNVWTRIGNRIGGETPDDGSGVSVDISDDGDVVAIGGFMNYGVNGMYSGHVRVYKRDQSNWVLVGGDLDGEASTDLFGRSVSISGDGSMLAVGGPWNDGTNGQTDTGHVRVFSIDMKTLQPSVFPTLSPSHSLYPSASPTLLPSVSPSPSVSLIPSQDNNLFRNGFWNQFGQSFDSNQVTNTVSISTNGEYIAIGEPSYACDAGPKCGKVEIYSISQNSWVPFGSAIIGNSANLNFGKSLELSSNGKAIIIGSLYGPTKVLEFDGDTWRQLGMDIEGEALDDLSGISVSIAGDGDISGVTHPYRYVIGIGAPYNDGAGENAGHVRIFGFGSVESWVQITADINGANDSDLFGMALALSRSGDTIALSSASFISPFNVKVYRRNDIGGWEQIGQDIVSNDLMDLFGNALSLSTDGNILAVGAPYADDSGSNSGSTKVFRFQNESWTQLGQTISEKSGEQSGSSVSLSEDGAVLAIGSAQPQAMRTYRFVEGKWIKMHDTIKGLQYVSLAGDGTRIVGSGLDAVQIFELVIPSATPSYSPSKTKSRSPSIVPSLSLTPSLKTSDKPSFTVEPSSQLSLTPSSLPTLSVKSSEIPSTNPSISTMPSLEPTFSPFVIDSMHPSSTSAPSKGPSSLPFSLPSGLPTSSAKPSGLPSDVPTTNVSMKPSESSSPSRTPSSVPSNLPSDRPTASMEPSLAPSEAPTINGTVQPSSSVLPSSSPTEIPTKIPSSPPSMNLSTIPSKQPSLSPSGFPSFSPSFIPSVSSTSTPSVSATPSESQRPTDIPSVTTLPSISPSQSLGPSQESDRELKLDVWSQVGNGIFGLRDGDKSGQSISLSKEGDCIAIGSPTSDLEDDSAGNVRVFERTVTGAWEQRGNILTGLNSNARFGSSVDVSDSCQTLAVGAILQFDTNPNNRYGSVTLYQFVDEVWKQKGDSIFGSKFNDQTGLSVSLSDNGNTVVVSSPFADDEINGLRDSGKVRIYEYSESEDKLVQIGQDLRGNATKDFFGFSATLSSTGDIIGIGSKGADSLGVNNNGRVNVFHFTGGEWNQLGQEIDGLDSVDQFGFSVSLSSDGYTMAIGSPFHNDSGKSEITGLVQVFRFSNGSWIQLGQNILGFNSGATSGWSTSLSSNGEVLAIGSLSNNGIVTGRDTGHVRVFELVEGQWRQVGEGLNGDGPTDFFGYDVSLSGNGMMLAASGPEGGGSGVVKTYELRAISYPSATPSYLPTESPSTSLAPTKRPSMQPSRSFLPSLKPSEIPSSAPTHDPSITPSSQPSTSPPTVSSEPSLNTRPSSFPSTSSKPSGKPSVLRSQSPSIKHSQLPTSMPSLSPTRTKSEEPSRVTGSPSLVPSISQNPSSPLSISPSFTSSLPFTSLPSTSSSPTSKDFWKQVGNLNGGVTGDYFGSAIAMSASGQTIIVGAPYDDTSRNNGGSVQIYTFVDNSYRPLGNKIILDEGKANDFFGTSVALSADGYTCIIGAPKYDGSTGNNSGGAKVLTFSANNKWVQKGGTIDGAAAGDSAGTSVDISEDGNTIAVGSPLNDANGNSAGHVRVFQYIRTNGIDKWEQVGDPISGEGETDSFGTALSLSGDGRTIGIGGPLNNVSYYDGHVRVLRLNNNNEWIQMGNDIDGEVKIGQFGGRVSLSQDGNTIGIGMSNGSNHAVKVFVFSDGKWSILGNSIDGFFGVALSNDGLIAAVGSFVGFGEVRVYSFEDGLWQQTGESITGDVTGSLFGLVVAISGDGSIAAGGAPNQSAGNVKIYYDQSNGSPGQWLRSGGRPYFPPFSSASDKLSSHTCIAQVITAVIACAIVLVV